MLHSKFHGNQPAGSGEEDFEGFYHIWAWRPSWLYVTSIMSSDFYFLVPESFHKKFGSDW